MQTVRNAVHNPPLFRRAIRSQSRRESAPLPGPQDVQSEAMESAPNHAFSEPLPAAMPQLSEKLHQGVPSSNPALYLGHEVSKSTTALGLRAALHLERIRSRYTGKERDAESGNDYFGARYYSSSMGRFMSPDRTPFGIAPGDPQSWNLYSYARNKPTTAIDVGGSWYTPIHKQMVDISLNGIMSAGEIAQLQHRQDVMDANASGMDDQRGHYMALPGQDPQVAKNNSDNLIDSNIAAASQGTDASGNMSSGALDHLGDAMHTLEDMTSPMHTTDNGTPLVWYGNFGHFGTNGVLHWMGENDASDSWARFGQAIRLTLAAYVQANPVGAGKHGLNGDNFMKEADRRTSEYVTQYYNMYRASEPEAEAARQCALGNPAACDH